MKNLLEEKNKTSYCQNATAFVQRSARLSRDTGLRLKMPARKPARPVLRALGVSFFFVRNALKKNALEYIKCCYIHSSSLLKLYIEKKINKQQKIM